MGAVHDKRMMDEEQILFPKDAFIWKDLVFGKTSATWAICHKKYNVLNCIKNRKVEN